MRKLILMRHAKAEATAPSGEDFDRGLTRSGAGDAALMGRMLAGEGLTPGLALVSDAERTRQTWDAVAEAFPQAEVRPQARLYNASSGEIRRAVEAVEDLADTVMVVGHNPGIPLYMLELMTEAGESAAVLDRVRSSFPPASVVVFDFDEHLRPSFSNIYFAKDHGGGGA